MKRAKPQADFAVDTLALQIDGQAAYDSILASTPADKLLVVECSATWCAPLAGNRRQYRALSLTLLAARCGPCKMFKPAYEQFAQAYSKDAVFTTIMGDANDDCKLLMTRLNVKSVPAFFFYRGGKQVSAFTGANKTGAYSAASVCKAVQY